MYKINTNHVPQFIIGIIIFLSCYISAQPFHKTDISKNQNQTIIFAGMSWHTKDSCGSPGPNNWSNSSQNVWVDSLGYLHLKIIKIDNKWYCSEIISDKKMDYGEYIFSINSDVAIFDPNAVVGIFLYQDDNHEIDIEFSRWGITSNNLCWYTVQPVNSFSQASFALENGFISTTHKILWSKNKIVLQSYTGNYSTIDSSNFVIGNWVYSGIHNPVPDSVRLHINFWLMNGLPPKNQKNMELIIKSVKIQPFSHDISNK